MKKQFLSGLTGAALLILCLSFSANAQWSLTGNAIAAGNFMGSTNMVNLEFRANNVRCGFVTFSGVTANTFWGYEAGRLNTGNSNVYHGYQAGYNATSGTTNTLVGVGTAVTLTTGSGNTMLGYGANVAVGGAASARCTALGYLARNTATADQVVLGSPAVTQIGGYQNWSNLSDKRYKKNIRENVPGLEFISLLHPVTYNVDIYKLNEKVYGDPYMNEEMDKAAIDKKASEVSTGFLAQDVEAAAKALNYDFDGVVKPDGEDGMYALRYSNFTVPLVKAVQELKAMNDEKDQTIAQMQNDLNALRSQMDELKSLYRSAIPQTAQLGQSVPNPSNHEAIISYTLPGSTAKAQIVVYDINGTEIKRFNVTGNDAGFITLNTRQMIAGNYFYTLFADGQIIETKKMTVSK